MDASDRSFDRGRRGPQPAAPGRRRRVAALLPHWRVLQACRPGRWNEPRGAWVSVGLVLLVVAVIVFGAAVAGKPLLGVVLAGVPVLALGWGMLIHGLLTQNRLIPALTVPGHVRVLREVASAAWVLALALSWLSALAVGFDQVASVLRIAALLAGIAVSVRWPWSWLVLWAVPVYGLPHIDQLAAVVRALPPLGRTGALLLVLALGPLWLVRLFGQGGESHRRWLRQVESTRRALAGDAAAWAGLGGGDGWWTRVGRAMAWPYRWSLDRAAAPRTAVPVVSRLLLAAGPTVHVGVHAWWLVLLAAVVGITWVAMAAWGPTDWTMSAAHVWGPAIGVMSLVLNPAFAWMATWRRTRREQALLVLVPGLPRGGALNRALARQMLRDFALAWSAGAVVLALLAARVPEAAPGLAVAAVALWPLAGLLCADLSRLPDEPQPRLLALTVCAGGLPIAALVLLFWAALPAPGLVVAIGAASLAWIAWRYRVLGRTPQGLPACRLA